MVVLQAHLIMNWEYVRDHEQEPWKASKQVSAKFTSLSVWHTVYSTQYKAYGMWCIGYSMQCKEYSIR